MYILQSKILGKNLRTLCDKHDEIYDLAWKITHYKDTDFDSVGDALGTIIDIADDIMTLVKDAKNDGCSMENRMREYRDAIEGLGFARKK